MSTKKFRHGGMEGMVLVWTPRGKLFLLDGPSTFGTLAILPAGRQGMLEIIGSNLGMKSGWVKSEEDSDDSFDFKTVDMTNTDRRFTRFKAACIALGIGEFFSAAANPKAPVWARRAFDAVQNRFPLPGATTVQQNSAPALSEVEPPEG